LQYTLTDRDALIVVDVQNDFCSGGALPVPNGEAVASVVNEYIDRFVSAGAVVCATRDWHPRNHSSFEAEGGVWPKHCVQGTEGAEILGAVHLPESALIVDKGTEREVEGYSGFEGTTLERELRKRRVERVFVCGLATDYCVKHTVLDALKGGFDAVLLLDASRGIDLKEGDVESAVLEMSGAGAALAMVDDIA